MHSELGYKGRFPVTNASGTTNWIRVYVVLTEVVDFDTEDGEVDYAEGDLVFLLVDGDKRRRVTHLGDDSWVIESTGEKLIGYMPAVRDLKP